MNRFIDIIPSRCVACNTCRAVCSAGHAAAGYQAQPRLQVVDNRTVAASMTCHHCEGAPCYRVCPTNALRKDDDGCIRCDESHCIGCKMCAIACPFGAIHMSGTRRRGVAGIEYNTPLFPWNTDPILRWEPGVFPVAVKCDLCEYNGYVPKCVEGCVTDALVLVEYDENDPDYLAKKRRQVQASQIMFENIDQAIPEGIQNLGVHQAADTYVEEVRRQNEDYIKGLQDLGLDLDEAEQVLDKKTVPPNGAVAFAGAHPMRPDHVEAIESAQREHYLADLEATPAHVRGEQVDTDNVIDQLSVGVTIPDIASHATAYRRALDIQEAGKAAGVDASSGAAVEAEDYLPMGRDAGVLPDPHPPHEPAVIHGDQVEYNPGKPEDPAVTESTEVDSPDDIQSDIH